MTLRFHEIAEGEHKILNAFTLEKLMLVGEICHLQPNLRQLDLACGKGEMLCQWAKRWGITGTGVDISKVFLPFAQQRAQELGVADQLTFIEAEAGAYAAGAGAGAFDIVSCIGATWIGQGLVGTLKLMLPALKPGGLLLVGEPYWIDPPPDEAYAAFGNNKDEFTSLAGTLDRFESLDLELVEIVLSNQDDWDRYAAAQWLSIDTWVRAHPDDPEVTAIREWSAQARRYYLTYERRYLGWGVFVLRAK
jgi:SAM-dependent methyltransferase